MCISCAGICTLQGQQQAGICCFYMGLYTLCVCRKSSSHLCRPASYSMRIQSSFLPAGLPVSQQLIRLMATWRQVSASGASEAFPRLSPRRSAGGHPTISNSRSCSQGTLATLFLSVMHLSYIGGSVLTLVSHTHDSHSLFWWGSGTQHLAPCNLSLLIEREV